LKCAGPARRSCATAGVWIGVRGTPTISIEKPLVAARALDLFAAGRDFADALHGCVADAAGATAFVTFDRRLAAKARKVGSGIVGAP
jgi:predicted nucleic acid-binding protein